MSANDASREAIARLSDYRTADAVLAWLAREGWTSPESIAAMSADIAAISAWVDAAPNNMARDDEARAWGRIAKVGEEVGEVIAAMIGATGQNPRKGVVGCMADVHDELLDVAVTALAAIEHLTGNRGESMQSLSDHIDYIIERAGITA